MSQRRMRNSALLASNQNCSSTQIPVAKTADDSLIGNHRHKKDSERISSKNKLPKSVRDDLENALVGLCDVWFEEIKPHLVRNNIKLHIHGAASGDHERQQEPSAAPTCSHVDPGAAPDRPQRTVASYASSSVMPPTASRVPCVKPQAHNRLKNQQPQPTLSLREYVQNPRPNCEDIRVQRPFKSRRKKRRLSQCEAHSNWRVPRLCRTYGNIPLAAKQLPKSSLSNENYSNIVPPRRHRKAMMFNKSTQTELSIPTGHVLSVSTQTHLHPVRTCSPAVTGRRPDSRREGTMLLSSPMAYHKPYHTQMDPVLFQDDLIDIISEKHEKRLKIIYNSPEQVDYPSLMYLMSPNRRTRKSRCPKTAPPWR